MTFAQALGEDRPAVELDEVTDNRQAEPEPAVADVRLGIHSLSGASGPPTRRLCTASWRRDVSPAANISRMYSERIDERFAARASAAFSVWARHSQKSARRIPAKASSVTVVSNAISSLDTV